VKGWDKVSQENGAPKKIGVTIITPDKTDFKPKSGKTYWKVS
jgi:hypothetical protein